MGLELLPLLAAQRELLETGRGFERFRRYLALMLDAEGEVALPLAAFNPMSKPHVAALLDTLIATGAENEVRAALAAATARLGAATPDLRVGLVVVDDAQGGWTNRYLTDADHRFGAVGEEQRGFATIYLWSAEANPGAAVRAETLSTIYRHCYKRRHGLPRSLREMLVLEGLAGRFAGATTTLDPDDLHRASAILAPLLDETSFPIVFACLYGDEAAIAVGYPPLGVAPWGGFAVASAHAAARHRDPAYFLEESASPPALTLG